MELLYWLQDAREHLRVSRQRNALRQPGQGIDYTADRDTVQRVVSRLHPRRMRLRVTDIIEETPSTKTFRFERVDGPLPPFRPGQYVNLFVDVDGVLTSRPYSISSMPPLSPPRVQGRGEDERAALGGEEGTLARGGGGEPKASVRGETTGVPQTLDLTVRDKPGGFVAPYLLHELRIGDELESTGPEGHFYYEPLIDGDDLVFLAGGSGITPFASMIREILNRGEEAPALEIHLLYGSRVPEDVIFAEELERLSAEHLNFHYSLVISEPPAGYDGLAGFLSSDLIREQIGDAASKTYYICGPNVMYTFCLAALTELGVPPHKIRRELYGPPDDVTLEPGWPEALAADTMLDIEVEAPRLGGPRVIQAAAGEPLLNSLERYGIVVPAVCRAGECSACRTRLLAGRVFQPAHTGLRESDREYGYIHACVSYPLENLKIRI